jgi:hypothetical protein
MRLGGAVRRRRQAQARAGQGDALRREDLAGLSDVEHRALRIDQERVAALRARGLMVWTPSIPPEVSPKHRLIIAAPHHTVVDGESAATLVAW